MEILVESLLFDFPVLEFAVSGSQCADYGLLLVSDQFLLFARQLVMWIMMLVMPTPGGSGFAEYIFSTYCRDLIEVPVAMQLGAATLIAVLWRLVTYYPYLVAGAIIFPRWTNRNSAATSCKRPGPYLPPLPKRSVESSFMCCKGA